MRKIQSNYIMCFILTFLLFAMNIQVSAKTLNHVTKVNLNKTTDILIVGKTDILKGTIAPINATNKEVKWISSNVTIAKVDATGKVTALKVGTATITAITVDKLLKATCRVTVNPVIRVTKLSLNKTTDILIVGKTDILKGTIAPINTTNKAVKWTSTNTSIVKVDATGKITALKVGTATITVTTVDKGLKSTCKVTVKPVVITKAIYVTKSGKKYHLGNCSSLKKSKISITLKDAKAHGFKPCSGCKPPQ